MNKIETRAGQDSSTPPEIREEFDAVLERLRTGKPLSPDMERRIHERAEKIRREVFEKHGLVDIGVQIIRELRGELPES